MPFAIWCTTCPKPTIIGQGVRFNAEKKKVGNYYTTPIFSFRMKHNVCGGGIEIRTDPKNTAYVVTEGAKKRDTGEDKVQDGEIRIRTDEERERLQNDAFAALEGKVADKQQAVTDKSRIEDLQRSKQKDWDDPYAASMKLRRAFRADRKVRQTNEALTEGLKDRMSLGMELLEETEEDRTQAGLVDFGDFDAETAVVKARSRPLFTIPLSTNKILPPKSKQTKAAKAISDAEERRERLRKELGDNTRAVLDPFLRDNKPAAQASGVIVGIKRKRDTVSESGLAVGKSQPEKSLHGPVLVDYDSE